MLTATSFYPLQSTQTLSPDRGADAQSVSHAAAVVSSSDPMDFKGSVGNLALSLT
jgi:hypothetical protein